MKALNPRTPVRVFYRAESHPGGYRYLRLLRPEAAAKGSIVGLSTGWVPATVAEGWHPSVLNSDSPEKRVLVSLEGSFADAYYQEGEPVQGMYWRVDRRHVVLETEPLVVPALSILVVRWWDYWNRQSQSSRSHNVANEGMLLDILEGPGSPHEALFETGSYEVHSAFLQKTADLEQVDAVLARSLRGERKAALYFLWPTQRDQGHACTVGEKHLFAAMRRMEEAGVRSCWPHQSELYRQLSGKLWTPSVSQEETHLRVPLTIRVDVSAWKASPRPQTEATLQELIRVIEAQRGVRLKPNQVKGVVKFGFSWMGQDVCPFTGADGLFAVFCQMLNSVSDDCEDMVCLVQERVEGVLAEFRLVCARDLATGPESIKWELVRMKQKPARRHFADQSFGLASHETMSFDEAAKLLGSRAAVEAAERQVLHLGGLWLKWFQTHGYATPGPAFRLDFLVSVPTRGSVEVYTVEVCECGGSLCGLSHLPRTTACLNECLHRVELPDQLLPSELPALHRPLPLPPFRSSVNNASDERRSWSSTGGSSSSNNNNNSNNSNNKKNNWRQSSPPIQAESQVVSHAGTFLLPKRLPYLRGVAAALAFLVAFLVKRLLQHRRSSSSTLS